MFYTAAYAAMNVGAFAVVSHFANAGERYVTLEDYEGLGRTSPLLAATLTIFLLSLIGIPMTGGFLRQVLRLQRRGESAPDLADADRRNQQRDRRVLLPPHHRRDVHAGIAQGGSGHADSRLDWESRSRSASWPLLYLGILPNRVLQYAQHSAQELLPPQPAALSANDVQTRPPAAVPQP